MTTLVMAVLLMILQDDGAIEIVVFEPPTSISFMEAISAAVQPA